MGINRKSIFAGGHVPDLNPTLHSTLLSGKQMLPYPSMKRRPHWHVSISKRSVTKLSSRPSADLSSTLSWITWRQKYQFLFEIKKRIKKLRQNRRDTQTYPLVTTVSCSFYYQKGKKAEICFRISSLSRDCVWVLLCQVNREEEDGKYRRTCLH